MKAREIDKGIGSQEEVGDDGSNGIQLSCREESHTKITLVAQ